MTFDAVSDVAARTYGLLAGSIDILHATAMIVWGVGLPLLFYPRHRFAALYLSYAVLFTFISFASHQLIGECVLTTAARELRSAGGRHFSAGSFTVQLVEFVAGIRPQERSAVLFWEAAIIVTALGALFSIRAHRHEAVSQNRGTPNRFAGGRRL